MIGILGIAAMLTVLALSLIITRIATVALVKTGLSHEAARFQARSAFTGTGFTTREAESVVDHPVRRRIIMVLMIVRSAGLVTIIISLILSFTDTASQQQRLWRLAFLTAGVLVLWVAAGSRLLDRFVSEAISRALTRWTDLDVRDYASLLKLSSNYSVTELRVEQHDWLEDKELRECNLDDEGVRVLGLYRKDGRYRGAPKGTTKVRAGDTLVLYGHSETLHELDERRAGESGEQAHERAMSEQRARDAEEGRDGNPVPS